MEVNYYGSGGSRLKSVFSHLFSLVKNENTGFIWITGGEGLKTAKRPLFETFNDNDYDEYQYN